jgi:hypothetical protein
LPDIWPVNLSVILTCLKMVEGNGFKPDDLYEGWQNPENYSVGGILKIWSLRRD